MKRFFSIFLVLIYILASTSHTAAEYSPSINEVNAANFLFQENIITNKHFELNANNFIDFFDELMGIRVSYSEVVSDFVNGKWPSASYIDAEHQKVIQSTIRAIVEDYRLGDTMTRKEILKVIAKLSNEEIVDTCVGTFSDVDITDWGCKYIEWALGKGYITGNDLYRPEDSITTTEVMKLILKVKGIEKTQVTSNWQEDYMMTAYEYGIISEKYYTYDANATRGWIFQIATATIEKEEEIKEIQEEKLMSDEAM